MGIVVSTILRSTDKTNILTTTQTASKATDFLLSLNDLTDRQESSQLSQGGNNNNQNQKIQLLKR